MQIAYSIANLIENDTVDAAGTTGNVSHQR